MANNLQLFNRRTFKLQNPLEVNPQLFREIKGKVSGRNIFIIALISILIQLFTVALYLGKLPDIAQPNPQYSRYCTGAEYNYSRFSCHSNLGIWQINWNLFWHDIFIFFTIISVFILLIIGTYMIIADLVQEEKTGTLNFIRLSPQSATNILLGKILGVPILIYFLVASTFPLHLISGLKANIPWHLILFFDLIVIASCAFFYSFATLFSLIKIGKEELKSWIITFIIALSMWITSTIFLVGYNLNNSLTEWLLLLNPVFALPYLLDHTSVAQNLVDYIDIKSLGVLLFYNQALWLKASTGMSFILLHFCLWTYWFWQGTIRLFHNPTSTIFSKKQSYWMTGWFVVIALGFTLQNNRYDNLFENFILLKFFLLVMFLGLIAALSPHRQTLYDWARYRHQLSKDGKRLGKELVFGEKSPSTVAIAINILIAAIIIAMGLIFFPDKEEIATAFWGLILTMGIILIYAVIAQWMLLMKTNTRAIWASMTISFLIIVPPILFTVTEAFPDNAPLVWFFSFIPAVATENASISALVVGLLGQWLAISLVSFQMIKKLRQAGRSQTKRLLDHKI
ncbi:MAG: hypothetical protein QNJ55_15435 [Xenococcus sp. MO_188.B8]|nr:hypothetical protein [Xenococcus sp. MO_188.B8]